MKKTEILNPNKVVLDKTKAEMNAATRDKLKIMKQLVVKEGNSLLASRRELGRHASDLCDRPDKYGQKVILDIARVLGCGRDLLDDARYLFETWQSDADFKKLAALRDTTRDVPISMQQAVEIAKLVRQELEEDATPAAMRAARKKWVERWREEGLTARDLRRERSKASKPDVVDSEGGPSTVAGFARMISANAHAFKNRAVETETRLTDLVDNDAKSVTQASLDDLKRAHEDLQLQSKVIAEERKAIAKRIKKIEEELEFERAQNSDRSENLKSTQKEAA